MLNGLTIIVPKYDNDGSDNSSIVEKTIREMCILNGGATVYEARGYWIGENDRLYIDEVYVIVSAKIISDEKRSALRALAESVLESTDQEAVLIAHDFGAEIVSKK